MNERDRLQALELIHDLQSETAPVTVEIGSVDPDTNVVDDTALVVHDCPPRVVSELNDAGFMLEMKQESGLKLIGKKS